MTAVKQAIDTTSGGQLLGHALRVWRWCCSSQTLHECSAAGGSLPSPKRRLQQRDAVAAPASTRHSPRSRCPGAGRSQAPARWAGVSRQRLHQQTRGHQLSTQPSVTAAGIVPQPDATPGPGSARQHTARGTHARTGQGAGAVGGAAADLVVPEQLGACSSPDRNGHVLTVTVTINGSRGSRESRSWGGGTSGRGDGWALNLTHARPPASSASTSTSLAHAHRRSSHRGRRSSHGAKTRAVR